MKTEIYRFYSFILVGTKVTLIASLRVNKNSKQSFFFGFCHNIIIRKKLQLEKIATRYKEIKD